MKRLPKNLQQILDSMEPGKKYTEGQLGRCVHAKLERLVVKGRINTDGERWWRCE